MAKGTLALRQIQLGDNADTSKNFVISVPAVADGTLTIERENGTDVLTIDASGKVTCTLTDNLLPLGVGQTWQNMTGSRALGAVYTNNTGRPIMVKNLASNGSSVGAAILNVNGSMVDYVYYIATQQGCTSAIIPAGGTYSNAGSTVNGTWWELR